MRSERSYSGLEPVAAGCTCEGSREGVVGTASLSFAGSLTAAPPCVRELLDGFSRAQPVPRTTSMTKALRPEIFPKLQREGVFEGLDQEASQFASFIG